MADVFPFKGLLYNCDTMAEPAKVMAPPYDVISDHMRNEFYREHRYNVVRLILGKPARKDTKRNNRYTRARDYMNDWLGKDILKQDKEPAFYVYEQKYLHKGKLKTRVGFIGLMRIEDPRKSRVLPHEYTFAGPKKDRLNLMTEAKANLSPIFSLFEDRKSYVTNILKKTTAKVKSVMDIERAGVNHRLWKIKDKTSIKKIKNFMKPKAIFIADGHHRYETALAFRDQMKKRGTGKSAYNRVMVYFSSLDPEAVTILSTYRVIKNIGNMPYKELLSRLKGHFEIKKFKDKKKFFSGLEKSKGIRLGMYCGRGSYDLLTLKNEEILESLISGGKSARWKRLPVTVLHQLVFNKILEVKENVAKEENIIYTRDGEYAANLVDKENYKAAFFLSPTSVDELTGIARSRERMPHKSTYFYPKLLSGLVINKF